MFSRAPTALDILRGQNLDGKVAIVTGSNTGIGYEVARALAKHHCQVVIACRNEQAAQTAIKEIKYESLNAQLDFIPLSLDSLESVKQFAHAFSKKYDRLDIIVFNAGVFGTQFDETKDGFEYKFQVNFLSNAYLTLLLEDKLKKGAPSRIILYSSPLQWFTSINLDNVCSEMKSIELAKKHHRMTAYANSRHLASIFSCQVAKKWKKHNISSFTVCPGLVNTDHGRHFGCISDRLVFSLARPFGKTPEQGAGAIMYVAASTELSGKTGMDSTDCSVFEHQTDVKDQEMGAKVWVTARELLHKAGHEVPEEILDD